MFDDPLDEAVAKSKGNSAPFKSNFDKFLDTLKSKGVTATLISGKRSREQQQSIWDRRDPKTGLFKGNPVAPPGSSLHEVDLARDYRFSGPLSINQIGELAESFGLQWGGRFKRRDPGHFQESDPLEIAVARSKAASSDDPLEQAVRQSKSADNWVPKSVLEQRRKLFGEPTAAKGKTDFSQVTGGAEGSTRTKLDHPYNASRILTEAAASPEAERRMKLREQIRNERQPGMFAGTPSIDALLHPVETVRRVVDPEGSLDDAVRERIDAERRQGSPEVTAIRKEYGAMPTVPTPMGQRIQTRSVAQPLARAGANILKLAGGTIDTGLTATGLREIAKLTGLQPQKAADWLNERGNIVSEAASLPPLDARGQEIIQGLPEKVTTAVADTGLSIAQIILLKRATGLPFGRLMGLEATLRTSDMPLDKRTQEVAKAAVLGKVLERHLSRKLSAAAFAGPTAVETGAAVGKGQMSLEDAILQTAVSGGTGFALGGGKKSLVDRLVAEKESGQKPVPEDVQVKPSEQKTSAEVSTKNVTDFDTYRDRAVERLTQKLEQERSPFREQRRYYEERLADPELARYAVTEKSPEGDLYAVPLGGSRKYGSSAVLYTKPEADRLLSRIQKLPGFDNARLRPVGEKFSIIWGEGGKFKSSEDLGRAYGYSEKAIAEFTTKKQSSVDNDPLITVYRGGELIPGKPQDYTTTREKAEKYAWNGVVSEIRVPKSMLDRYRVSEFRHDDYYLITPPKGEQIIRSDAVEPTPAVRQQATPATAEPRIETVTEPPAAVSPPSTTSARKATMAADRAELDLPELPPAERKSWQTTLDNAKSRGLDREATNLADEVLRKPRILDDEQTAGIVLRAQQVKNEHAAAMEKVRSASGAELESATDRLKSLEHELDRLTTAAKTSGSEKGRALAAQKLTINQDYDLISVLTRAKAAKGSDLTPKERVEYTELQQKYEALEKQLAEMSDASVTNSIQKEINRVRRREGRSKSTQSLDVEFADLRTQFAQARAQVKNVQASGLAGIDPEGKLTVLLGKMARNRIQAGVVKAEQLVDEIYNAIKDQVEGLTKREVRDAISGYGSTSHPSRDAIAAQLRELRSQLRLVSALEDAEGGQRPLKSGFQREAESETVRDLRKRVQQTMREHGITEPRAERAPRSPEDQWKSAQDTAATRLRNQIAELDARLAGAERTEVKTERKPDSDTVVALRAERDLLKKALDDPLTKNKERVRGQIAELERKLQEGDISPAEKKFVYKDAELQKLEVDRRALQKELAALRRIPDTEAALRKQITELDAKITSGDLSRKSKPAAVSTPAIDALRAERQLLQKHLNEMRRQARPQKDPKEQLRERLQNEIMRLETEIKSGFHPPRPARVKREPTDEEFKLIRKRDDLKRHIEAKLRHDAMSSGERLLREVGNVIGLYRSAMTSIDASFGLRQGKIGLSRHPSLWADAWKKQWAGVSNEKYDRAVWRIENDPDFPLMDRFGLETPSVAMKHSFSLTAKNEDFPSEWTQKIPVLRQSEQMFNLMGDVLRTSWFKSDLKMLQKAGFDPNNPEHADVFRKSAEDINTYTGRTNLQHLVPGKAGKALHQATPVLNQLTFAIRFWASRLKVLTLPLDPRMYPQIPRTMKLYKSMPRAQRVEAWKTLFAFYGLVATQLKAAQLAGAEIDVDPDSPDFLKARFEGISDRHFDVSAGTANHLRFAARMAKRIYEAKSGKPRKGFGNAPGAVIESYLRSKESPPVSIFHDIFLSRQTKEGRGTDFRGDPVYPWGEPGTGVVGRLKSARLLPKPIVMNDAIEAYDEMGWTGVATTLPFTFLGESVSVYKDGKKKKATK